MQAAASEASGEASQAALEKQRSKVASYLRLLELAAAAAAGGEAAKAADPANMPLEYCRLLCCGHPA